MSNPIIRKWKGAYVYGDGQSNKFTLEVTELNGNFTGICYEDAFAELASEQITIRGFIDGNIISFVKHYPFLMALDRDGNLKVDRTQPHPQIHYRGYYDEQKNIFSGEWELFYELPGDGVAIEVQAGEWIMKAV